MACVACFTIVVFYVSFLRKLAEGGEASKKIYRIFYLYNAIMLKTRKSLLESFELNLDHSVH